jgi:hypothetical protein
MSARKRNTDKAVRNLKELNILSEPSCPPLTIPIAAEPKLRKIRTIIAITKKTIILRYKMQKKDP